MTRTDDIINVAATACPPARLRKSLAAHPDVAECAVMGVADPLKGQVPLGLVVLKAGGRAAGGDRGDEVVALVRERIGPVASFKTALVVDRLPKTRSGKILRGTMRRIADGEDYRMPATIDDPAILGEIEEALGGPGIRRRNSPLPHCGRGFIRHLPPTLSLDRLALLVAARLAAEFLVRRSSLSPAGRLPRRARATAWSSSCRVHRPSPTGWRGLMLALFQWVRSRTPAIVGLVVPISFEICASDSSGWLRSRT